MLLSVCIIFITLISYSCKNKILMQVTLPRHSAFLNETLIEVFHLAISDLSEHAWEKVVTGHMTKHPLYV